VSKTEIARVSARPKAPAAALPPELAEPVVVKPGELVAHAYALVQDERGGWHALHLEGVSAEKITRMEPNRRPEPGMFAVSRIKIAVEDRLRLMLRDQARISREAKAKGEQQP